MTNETRAQGADKPALIVGVLLLVVAFFVGYDASQQTITSNYGIGPTAMPYVVTCGLVILGLSHFIVAFRGGLPKPDAADNKALLWIVAGLVCLIGCIALDGGFIIAIALLFACTARGMGRQAFAVDLAIGFVLGLAIFLTFAKLLTLILPSGPLERLFL
ncbi:tripartite tricarboxylate transporter TctB family protein [Bosea sp. AS-1]|jgi:putative tricarboxylic transport membrane protein|uniref:tripartite tricarboxylate transporter TctB family protein n=1 Tax=Bosea sp. AS-1 TaxID=2015316 RepID=UPI000B779C7B|nr:tripartite tricarboxylate transporter TctB family protein [Bosea sp. AS-1]